MSKFICANGVWKDAAGVPVKVAPVQSIERYPVKSFIPYVWAEEAYKEYSAQYGTNQTLERLNERGGFGAEEIIGLLIDRIKRLQAKEPR